MDHSLDGSGSSRAYASWNPALRPNRDPDETSETDQAASTAESSTDISTGELQHTPEIVEGEAPDSHQESDHKQQPASAKSAPDHRTTENGTFPVGYPEGHKGDTEVIPRLETSYEHQSDITFMDEAIQEDASAALVTTPSFLTAQPEKGTQRGIEHNLEWAEVDATFEIESNHQDSMQTSFNPIESLAPSSSKEQPLPDIDWGTSDNVSFDVGGAVQRPEDEAPSTAVPKLGEQPDLDSAWAAVLDDDEFLPEDATTAAAFCFDDDEGFLDDTRSAPADELSTSQPVSINRYVPPQTAESTPNPLSFSNPTKFTDFAHLNGTASNLTKSYGVSSQSPVLEARALPATLSSTHSFAAQSKGGYQSPYDLPEGLTKSRKRPATQHSNASTNSLISPPPRTPSAYAVAGNLQTVSTVPSSSEVLVKPPVGSISTSLTPKPPSTASGSTDFFAELPIGPKPRAPSAMSGRYTPQPPSIAPTGPSKQTESWSAQMPEPSQAPLISGQLRQPERLSDLLDPHDNPAVQSSLSVPAPPTLPPSGRYSPAPVSVPPVASRYSPVPPGSSGAQGPPALLRYSPVPSSQPLGSPPLPGPVNSRFSPNPPQGNFSTQPRSSSQTSSGPGTSLNKTPSEPSISARPAFQQFIPRTSSPLAQNTALKDNPENEVPTKIIASSTPHRSQDSLSSSPLHYRSSLEEVREVEESDAITSASNAASTSVPDSSFKSSTPPPRSRPSSITSPRRRVQSNHVSQYPAIHTSTDATFAPPRRSQSQSPGATIKFLQGMTSFTTERPASAHAPISTPSSISSPPASQVLPHRKGFSQDMDYIVPTDERANDPLQRWKGHSVFNWGLGGTVVTSFPKYIPRYGTGQLGPQMKCSPGEIRLVSTKDINSLPEMFAKFPGPLKGKGKKKDVLAWLKTNIEVLEQERLSGVFESAVVAKRQDEKILLWKILSLLVEHDGRLEGSTAIEQAVRAVLSSDTESEYAANPPSILPPDAAGSVSVGDVQNLLSLGDREKAVWSAADNRLWGHALLIASTLGRDIWKRVVQEFVQKEVRAVGSNGRALAALYEVFAGNWEESIDELVPASARAGFHMINATGQSASNATEGLEQWRDSLLLILGNRTEGDTQALLSLGRLLAEYQRTEAAHICFLFARTAAFLGGADDPNSDIVLVGLNHKYQPHHLGDDLDSVLLTEVLEYAISLGTSGVPSIPHLQPYKLAHAYVLAEQGLRNDALQYCDAIAASIKATTRGSPYHHVHFINQLDDLSKRLSQSPKDPSSSWISKPSMEKVSGSLLAKFNSFVAGDDTDAVPNHSGTGGDVGPFAKITGNTPSNLSPSQSNTDLYGAYLGNPTAAPSTSAPVNSRYAPTSNYTSRSVSGDLPSKSRYEPASIQPAGATAMDLTGSQSSHNSAYQTSSYTHYGLGLNGPSPGNAVEKSIPPVTSPHAAYPSEPVPVQQADASSNYEPPSMGYEPPSMTYEPPSYQPYEPEPEPTSANENGNSKPLKKSFMDDEGDEEVDGLVRKAAALKQKNAQADKDTDEAFRKAAEADAARDKQTATDKKGWFGGWFGAKKDLNTPVVYKAKLGEESSFVYDPELKRWVNKKASSEASTPGPSGTPPPPKSMPPRTVSASGLTPPPTAGPPMTSSAPPTRPPTSNPTRSASMPIPPRSESPARIEEGSPNMPPPLLPPGISSKPPSRPGTAMSNASSIDDLLGAPQARRGATKKAKKGGRYVDVMSGAS